MGFALTHTQYTEFRIEDIPLMLTRLITVIYQQGKHYVKGLGSRVVDALSDRAYCFSFNSFNPF